MAHPKAELKINASSAATLSELAEPPPRAPSAALDQIREILEHLVRERQDLRVAEADPATLEANRQAIVYWQLRLAAAVGSPDRLRPDGR